MYSVKDDTELTMPGCPIQKSPGQRMFSSLPRLIAAFHVFLLHLTPRHPPFALSSLATIPQISLNALMFKILIFTTTNCQRTKRVRLLYFTGLISQSWSVNPKKALCISFL